MEQLRRHLGAALSVKEVAEILAIDIKTVRKYYQRLGGIRLGRTYRFFEKEVQHAIQTWHEMARTSISEGREVQKKNLPDQKGSDRVGSGRTEKGAASPAPERDPYGLLA
ncbi:helix-turn-helix domain-containing protein [Thiovibrio sp. JS02]